jgi:isochorismate synthase
MSTPALSASSVPKLVGSSEYLSHALESMKDPSGILCVSVPGPLCDVEALLDAVPEEDAVLWDPPEGTAFAAAGSVATLRGSGESRISEIRTAADQVFSRVRAASLEAATPSPRCFGGFSFQAGSAAAEPWSEFGDARFVLPRYRYARSADRAWLTIAARGDELATDAQRRAVVAKAEAILAVLRTATDRPPHFASRSPKGVVTGRKESSEADWRDLVGAIVERIGRGEFEKIVIARRTALTFDRPVDILDVLAELASSSANCTRFAFRFGGGAFLGATPERLVRRAGLNIDTVAVAGTTRVGDAAGGAEMMKSPKEREEHEIVVREILSNLSPVCATLDHPAVPEVRVLRHLLHLTTPIRGRLAKPIHVLDLVGRLHPTPAVGGVPAREAVRYITQHEPAERGWYASPIGSFDAEGDGDFAVALRSGAFVGDRAYLYAGGGIVRDSNPVNEYAETRLKLAPLCAALHVTQ